MRVLLVITPGNYPMALPCFDLVPQGPAYISAVLRAQGHEVHGVCIAYDTSGEPAPVVLERMLRRAIEQHQPDVIAMGAMAAEYLFLRDAIAVARQAAPHTPVVCGGSIMTNDRTAMTLLKPDLIVMDEGERTVIELLERLDKGEAMQGLQGAGYWQGGEAHYNTLRPAIEDLDALPFPEYEAQDIRTYFKLANQLDNYFHARTQQHPRMVPLSSGRSCPFRCTFCQYATVEGSRRRYRGRTMASVIREVEHLHDRYQLNILKIYDDLFSVKEDRILEFCTLLRETGLDIHWNASMRVGDVNPRLLHEMKAAGCIHIGYGFESASDTVLSSMNKRITQAQIANAIDMTEAAGIGVQANFIFGDPAESLDTIADTVGFYRIHCVDHIVHNDYITPYPGSPIFDHCVEHGMITSKKDYYETIHLRPRINMTKVRHKVFYGAVEPLVRMKLEQAKFAKDVVLKAGERTESRFGEGVERLPIEVTATCPHCELSVAYLFPKRGIDLKAEHVHYALVEPIRYYCDKCHKRLLIPLLSLTPYELSFRAFVASVNTLADAGTSVCLTPLVGAEMVDVWRGWGLRFDDLNVHSVYARHRAPDGLEFLGHRVFELTEANLQRYRTQDFIVAPVRSEGEVITRLEAAGIEPERIHSWHAHRNGRVQAMPRARAQRLAVKKLVVV